jgi:hypothetical protein
VLDAVDELDVRLVVRDRVGGNGAHGRADAAAGVEENGNARRG